MSKKQMYLYLKDILKKHLNETVRIKVCTPEYPESCHYFQDQLKAVWACPLLKNELVCHGPTDDLLMVPCTCFCIFPTVNPKKNCKKWCCSVVRAGGLTLAKHALQMVSLYQDTPCARSWRMTVLKDGIRASDYISICWCHQITQVPEEVICTDLWGDWGHE